MKVRNIFVSLATFVLLSGVVAVPAFAKVDRVPGPLVYGPWNVSGDWVFDYHYGSSVNLHDMTLVQDEAGSLTGSGGAFSGSLPYQYPWTIVDGSVNGDAINITANYDLLPCSFSLEGTIHTNGTMSGTWEDNCFGTRNGTWSTTEGEAARESSQFTGNHGQYVKSMEDKQEAAQSEIGMPVQSQSHVE